MPLSALDYRRQRVAHWDVVARDTDEPKGLGGYYLARADAFQGHLHPDRTEYSVLFRNLGGNRFADVHRPDRAVVDPRLVHVAFGLLEHSSALTGKEQGKSGVNSDNRGEHTGSHAG